MIVSDTSSSTFLKYSCALQTTQHISQGARTHAQSLVKRGFSADCCTNGKGFYYTSQKWAEILPTFRPESSDLFRAKIFVETSPRFSSRFKLVQENPLYHARTVVSRARLYLHIAFIVHCAMIATQRQGLARETTHTHTMCTHTQTTCVQVHDCLLHTYMCTYVRPVLEECKHTNRKHTH